MTAENPASHNSLEELTGRKIDPAALYEYLRPGLEARNQNLITHIAHELTMNGDLVRKVARYGERTPAAPHLAAISELLEAAIKNPLAYSNDELLELFGQWRHEIEEAERYFHG